MIAGLNAVSEYVQQLKALFQKNKKNVSLRECYVAFPYSTVGWSEVWDCGIAWPRGCTT